VTIILDVVEKAPVLVRSVVWHAKFQKVELFTTTGYGWAGTYYFIDPTSGIAAICCTQVLPTLDSEVLKIWQEAEEALYEGLEAL
jgi:hypothetical protein